MSDDKTHNLPSSEDNKLSEILAAVRGLGGRLESLEAKVESLDAKVGSLDAKVEDRLYDTRPIWVGLVADIAGLREGQDSLREGQDSLRKEVESLRRVLNVALRDIDRKISIFNDRLLR
jgi:hypothetical protein